MSGLALLTIHPVALAEEVVVVEVVVDGVIEGVVEGVVDERVVGVVLGAVIVGRTAVVEVGVVVAAVECVVNEVVGV